MKSKGETKKRKNACCAPNTYTSTVFLCRVKAAPKEETMENLKKVVTYVSIMTIVGPGGTKSRELENQKEKEKGKEKGREKKRKKRKCRTRSHKTV